MIYPHASVRKRTCSKDLPLSLVTSSLGNQISGSSTCASACASPWTSSVCQRVALPLAGCVLLEICTLIAIRSRGEPPFNGVRECEARSECYALDDMYAPVPRSLNEGGYTRIAGDSSGGFGTETEVLVNFPAAWTTRDPAGSNKTSGNALWVGRATAASSRASSDLDACARPVTEQESQSSTSDDS